MNLALNEVEAIAKKAARGAGYSWGLAEEAAMAARWLCARGIDGCAALAALLEQGHEAPCPPTIGAECWVAPAGALCPLATGAAIADRADDLLTADVRLGRVNEPILLLPFAACAAERLGTFVRLVMPGAVVATDGEGLSIEGMPGPIAAHVTVAASGVAGAAPRARYARATPAAATWASLERFAHRTYAPATEVSRQRGAGTGLSDND